MGAASSELRGSLERLDKLRNKPAELKNELSQFVALCPPDTPLPIKLNPKLFDLLMALLADELQSEDAFDTHMLLQAISRLSRCRTFYTEAARSAQLTVLVRALLHSDSLIVLSALNTCAYLLTCQVTPETSKEGARFSADEAEAQLKFAFHEHKGWDALCAVLLKYASTSFAGVKAKVLDLLSLATVDRLQTTRFHILQRIVAKLTPSLNAILQLTATTVVAQESTSVPLPHQDEVHVKAYAVILLSGLLLHSSLDQVKTIQAQALREGWLLYYILYSIDCGSIASSGFAPAQQHVYVQRLYNKHLCALARNLLGLLCSGSVENQSLLRQLVPIQLHGQLEEELPVVVKDPELPPEPKSPDSAAPVASAKLVAKTTGGELQRTLWYAFQHRTLARCNCDALFANLDDTYRLPHFIWTPRMKYELLQQLWSELAYVRQLPAGAVWQASAFEVNYDYLNKYCRVGNFYLRPLLEVLDTPGCAYTLPLPLIHQLLAALFQRSVIETRFADWKLSCLTCIQSLYRKYSSEFKDFLLVPYLIFILDPAQLPFNNSNRTIHTSLLQFACGELLREPVNARRWTKFEGARALLHYVNAVHAQAVQQKKGKHNKQATRIEYDASKEALPVDEQSESDAEETEAPAAAEEEGKQEEEQFTLPRWPFDAAGNPLPEPKPSATAATAAKAVSPPAAKGKDAKSPTKESKKESAAADSNAPMLHTALSSQPQPLPRPSPEALAWENSDAPEELTSLVAQRSVGPFESCALALRGLRLCSASDGGRLRRALCAPTTVSLADGSSASRRLLLQSAINSLVASNALVRTEAAALLLDVLRSQQHLLASLQSKYGMFTLIAYSLSRWPMTVELAALIDLTHLAQTPTVLEPTAEPGSPTRVKLHRQASDASKALPVENEAQRRARAAADAAVVSSYRSPASAKSGKSVKSPASPPAPTIAPEPVRESALAPYLPAALVHLTTTQGAVALARVLNSDEPLVDATLVWNTAMRETELKPAMEGRVQPYLSKLAAHFSSAAATDSALYPQLDFDASPVVYSSLAAEPFVGGVYIRHLNAVGQRDLNTVRLQQPDYTLQELIRATSAFSAKLLQDDAKVEELNELLMSQAIVVSRYATLPLCTAYPAFATLLTFLPGTLSPGDGEARKLQIDTLQNADCQLMNALLLADARNAQQCFDDKGLDALSKAVVSMAAQHETNLTQVQSLIHVLACLSLLARKHPPALRHVEHDAQLCGTLVGMLTAQLDHSLSVVCSLAQLLANLVISPKLGELFLQRGLLLALVRVLTLSAGEQQNLANPHNSGVTPLQAQVACCNVLTALVHAPGAAYADKLAGVLKQMLGGAVVQQMDAQAPEAFVRACTDAATSEVKQYLGEQLQRVEQEQEWAEWTQGKVSYAAPSAAQPQVAPQQELEEE